MPNETVGTRRDQALLSAAVEKDTGIQDQSNSEYDYQIGQQRARRTKSLFKEGADCINETCGKLREKRNKVEQNRQCHQAGVDAERWYLLHQRNHVPAYCQ